MLPYPSLPGFGQNIGLPDLGLALPEGFPENIFDLLNKLKIKWPGGIDLQGYLDSFMKKLSHLLANLLTQMSVFLAIYNLILAIIQMIVCIIEVLCGAIRKIPKKLKKLFRTCIPIFISIFPFLALIALILAIIAMLMALINYIIAMLKKIWEELKRNFENLKHLVLTDGNRAGNIAVVRKISSILCILENVLIMFLLVKVVIDTIKALLKRKINKPCSGTSDCSCCTSCSDLLQHPDQVANKNLTITYSGSAPLVENLDATEVVTAISTDMVSPYRFTEILSTTFNGCNVGPFFPPQPIDSYTADRAPYVLNIKMPYTSSLGTREIVVNDVVVAWVEADPVGSGKVRLVGGKAEDPSKEITGYTLLQCLRGKDMPKMAPGIPVNSITVSGTIGELKVNLEELFVLNLTSADCMPEVAAERDAFFATIDDSMLDDLVFPDIGEAMDNMTNAINGLRANFNDANIDNFYNNMNGILGDLLDQAENTYTDTLNFMVSPLHSTASLSPEIQFTGKEIDVIVVLRNAVLQTIKDVVGDYAIPTKTQDALREKITAEASLGVVSDFTYDNDGNFVAKIASTTEGDGILKVFWDKQQLGQIIRPVNLDEPTTIVEIELPYSFVGFTADEVTKPRRDESDTANNR